MIQSTYHGCVVDEKLSTLNFLYGRISPMLVISRRRNEAVCIGNDIIVRVLESKGGQVRLGINAPKQVPVLRQELCLVRAAPLIQNGAKEMACAFGHL